MGKTKIQKALNDYINKAMEQVDKDLKSAINYTNNELYDEAINMFNYYIEEFYKYRTTSYIRDYEGVSGTRKGSYLYGGKLGAIFKSGSWNKPMLTINPEKFGIDLGERKQEYQHNSPYEVMQNVITNVRFVGGGNRYLWRPPYYSGKYYNFSGGSIKDAFISFNMEFDEIAEKIIRKQMNLKGYK